MVLPLGNNMQREDLVRWSDIVHSLPKLISKLPTLLEGFSLTRLDNPSKPVGLALEFERAAIENPLGIAILGPQQRLTYSEANRQANQLARSLRSQGIGKGDVVGIFISNRPEVLLCVLACAKLGAISAMLNTLKTKNLLLESVQMVAPKLLMLGSELNKNYLEIAATVSACRIVVQVEDNLLHAQAPTLTANQLHCEYTIKLEDLKNGFPTNNLDSSRKIYLHDPCFYIFTSGTSGLPKVGIFTQGRWMKVFGGIGKLAVELKQDDVLYATIPLYHATALCVCWSAVISARAGLAIGRKFSATQFWQEVQRFHATAIGYVGDLCQFLLVQPPRESDQAHSVRMMLGNGLRPVIWKKFKQRFGVETVYEFYGASDGNVGFFNLLNIDNTVGFSPNRYALVAIDQDEQQPIRGNDGFFIRVNTGEVGLLISEINTHFPLDGYTDKTQTEKIIIKSAFETGDRWLNTGDLMVDLGFRHAQFADRIGDSYRWHGENVSSQEVENVIMEYPLIEQAIVYGVKIPHASGRAGMATIELSDSAPFNASQRKSFAGYLRTHLPSYAVPRLLRVTKQLDTTATFKFKKKNYQQQGYDLAQVKDPLFVYNLQNQTYQALTKSAMTEIDSGALKL